MRIHYILKDNSIDDLAIEPCEPLLYNVYPQDYGYMANHLGYELTKGQVINTLMIIQQRKKKGLEAYQIKGLSKNFISIIEKLGITKDMLLQIVNNPYVEPKEKEEVKFVKKFKLKRYPNRGRYKKQHKVKKPAFRVSY